MAYACSFNTGPSRAGLPNRFMDQAEAVTKIFAWAATNVSEFQAEPPATDLPEAAPPALLELWSRANGESGPGCLEGYRLCSVTESLELQERLDLVEEEVFPFGVGEDGVVALIGDSLEVAEADWDDDPTDWPDAWGIIAEYLRDFADGIEAGEFAWNEVVGCVTTVEEVEGDAVAWETVESLPPPEGELVVEEGEGDAKLMSAAGTHFDLVSVAPGAALTAAGVESCASWRVKRWVWRDAQLGPA